MLCAHRCRSSYYNADTADLEIGQEFEDAEAEEEAALELQRASYKRLDPADYGEEEEEEGEGKEKRRGQAKGKRKGKAGRPGAATAQGVALLAMKSDLEQIALGASGEVCLCVCGVLTVVCVSFLLSSIFYFRDVLQLNCACEVSYTILAHGTCTRSRFRLFGRPSFFVRVRSASLLSCARIR